MTIYKIIVSKDGTNFEWVVVNNWFSPAKVIWNPTEDDLRNAIQPVPYGRNNICPICIEENSITDNSILYPTNVLHETRNDYKIGKWICRRHGFMSYQRYNPNSTNNVMKSIMDHRIGSLNDHTKILGDNCEDLTKEWLGVKRLSVEYDKYSMLPHDHSPIPAGIFIEIGGKLIDLSGKIPQTKGRIFSSKNGWKFSDLNLEFDIVICYCISKDGKIIERIYIIPKDDIINVSCIGIYKNPKDKWGNHITSKYEKYMVTNEDVLKMVNEIWKDVIKWTSK